jgi:hypothetical protein
MNVQGNLIEKFVRAFALLDHMNATAFMNPEAPQLSGADGYGHRQWWALKCDTSRHLLKGIYAKLPGRFPPLFERLVLSYRWAEVDLQLYRLLANPPGPGLNGLFHEMTKDSGLCESLVAAGFIQFGKGPDVDYDPVCFDTKTRKKNGDCRIVTTEDRSRGDSVQLQGKGSELRAAGISDNQEGCGRKPLSAPSTRVSVLSIAAKLLSSGFPLLLERDSPWNPALCSERKTKNRALHKGQGTRVCRQG